MTNEEIKNIPEVVDLVLDESITADARVKLHKRLEEVCDLAIQALEQQPCEDTEVIKVSKGAVKARQGRYVIYDVDWLKENFYSTEEKIYGQPKQPCEDCISRQSLRRKLQKHHDFFVNAYGGFSNLPQNDKSRVDEIDNCIAMVVNEPSVTPTSEDIKEAYIKGYDYGVKDWFKSKTQPCEDAVSREAVEEITWDWENFKTKLNQEGLNVLKEVRERVADLPSVTPEKPKGKWMDNSKEDSYYANCSHCGYQIDTHYERGYLNYCPNCGAEMGGAE